MQLAHGEKLSWNKIGICCNDLTCLNVIRIYFKHCGKKKTIQSKVLVLKYNHTVKTIEIICNPNILQPFC